MVELRIKRTKDSRILHDDDTQEVKDYFFSRYPKEEIVQEVVNGYVTNELQLGDIFN